MTSKEKNQLQLFMNGDVVMWEKRGKAYPGALAVFSAAPNKETCNYRQKVMTFCFENVKLQSKNKMEAVNQTSKWFPGILWPQKKVSKRSLEVDCKCFNEHNWDYKVFAGSWEKANWTDNASKIWFINGVDNVNWPPNRDWKADVSSISLSSERMGLLW